MDCDLKLAVNLPNVVNMVEGCGIGAQNPFSAAVARARGALRFAIRWARSFDDTS